MSGTQLQLSFGGQTTPKKMDLSFIDLFAGIGGIRLGFQDLFGHCVFSSEIDKFSCQTYHANFGETPAGDITQIDEDSIPPFDILLAGFPCQPFSQAGLKKGFEDSRGTLFFDIARIINRHKPKVVFLENVKGFKGHDKGRTFDTVKRILSDMGYMVHAKVLNAKNFGVPQNRERIYIVGFLGRVQFSFPTPPYTPTRVGDILENSVDPKYTISDRSWTAHKERKLRHLANGNGFGHSVFGADSPYTRTIKARYYKDGSEALIEQPGDNPRRLTPREVARLQGFPESYTIPVSDTQAYRQFGNSVAIPVIKALAEQINISLINEK